jgi:hypothetical protein
MNWLTHGNREWDLTRWRSIVNRRHVTDLAGRAQLPVPDSCFTLYSSTYSVEGSRSFYSASFRMIRP